VIRLVWLHHFKTYLLLFFDWKHPLLPFFIYYYDNYKENMGSNKRLISLDVFRGLTIAFMIIVNNPGNWNYVYPPLLHSKWNGCTPTDLVFPFFLFIVGTAMWYSYKKSDQTLTGSLALRIFRRAILIYLIGLAINAYSKFEIDPETIRIMGVLARIAIAYLIASFIVLLFRRGGIIITTAVILLGYWAILLFFGGKAPFSLEDNFARTFDIAVLGINHIPVFHGVKFDQTGLLSTLPSIANILLGYLAGRLIDVHESKIIAVRKLILFGISGVIIAVSWDLVFPVNKPLWTSSFVLYTCGIASISLGFLYWLIDLRGFKGWTMPFQVFGMNSIFIYVFSEFLAISLWIKAMKSDTGEAVAISDWIFNYMFLPVGPYMGSLIFALIFTFVCWLAGLLLYKLKIFIRL
jgi:predicted acyltransferase